MRSNYFIPDYNVDELQAKIDKMARRAARIGVPAPTVALTGEQEIREVSISDPVYGDTRKVKILFVEVLVTGDTPRYEGWQFIGTIEFAENGNVIRQAAHDVEIPARFLNTPKVCEHCETKRTRKDTYLVQGPDGQIKQVGKTCLQNYTGGLSPQAIAGWLSIIEGVENKARELGEVHGERYEPVIDATYYLACSAYIIRTEGWVSKSAAWDEGRVATAYLAEELAYQKGDFKNVKPATEDYDKAAATLEWAHQLPNPNFENNYLHNLAVILRSDYLTPRQLGFAASAIVAYEKILAKKLEESRPASSNYVGEIGKRQPFTNLKLEIVFHYESEWGVMHIHKFTDASSNVIVWKTGSVELDRGGVFDLVATVKDHSEYKGEMQTVITRATKITEVEE